MKPFCLLFLLLLAERGCCFMIARPAAETFLGRELRPFGGVPQTLVIHGATRSDAANDETCDVYDRKKEEETNPSRRRR